MHSRYSFFSNPKEAYREYLEVGFHIEPNMWTADECDGLIQASHELPQYTSGVLTPVMHPHRVDERFLSALKHRKVVDIVSHLITGGDVKRVSGLQTEVFYGRPGTPGFSFHQDNAYVEGPMDGFVSAWSALEDVTPENGGLIVCPKSHLEPLLPTREVLSREESVSQDPNANKIEAILPPQYEKVSISVARGSTVFIHAHLVHASNKNKTTERYRHVLLATYLRSGEKFRPGFYSKREEVKLY